MYDDDKLELAADRCHTLVSNPVVPRACRTAAWQLLSLCTPNHTQALTYLHEALGLCAEMIEIDHTPTIDGYLDRTKVMIAERESWRDDEESDDEHPLAVVESLDDDDERGIPILAGTADQHILDTHGTMHLVFEAGSSIAIDGTRLDPTSNDSDIASGTPESSKNSLGQKDEGQGGYGLHGTPQDSFTQDRSSPPPIFEGSRSPETENTSIYSPVMSDNEGNNEGDREVRRRDSE